MVSKKQPEFFTVSEHEHPALVIGLASIQMLLGLASAVVALGKGRNCFLWFFIALVPIVGLFAALFFLIFPQETAEAEAATTQQPAAQSRKGMSRQERRLAFALICYLIAFALVTGPINMPGWVSVLLYLGGVVVLLQFFGSRDKEDEPEA
jgi:hypothetical protein